MLKVVEKLGHGVITLVRFGVNGFIQVGVVHEGHHAFRLGELLTTMRETTTRQKLTQLKAIFSLR